jgi:hypothetical protein
MHIEPWQSWKNERFIHAFGYTVVSTVLGDQLKMTR